MGTNFYWKKAGNVCPTCNRKDEVELHIGKSSGGWCFSLHVYPDDGINDLSDWLPKLLDPESVIWNEYGDQVSVAEMLRWIARRGYGADKARKQDASFYSQNYAEPGPNGLARHQLGHGCISQGAGTWDCITGDFS
jgi:hypothetical protein